MQAAASRMLIVSNDEAFRRRAEAMMKAQGWTTNAAQDLPVAVRLTACLQPAALVIDAENAPASEISETIRGLAAPANGTPIFTVGGARPLAPGAGGHLNAGWSDDELLALLRRWAGPLDNHGLRAEPWTFRYRLIRLIGLEAADGMLHRLKESLERAVEDTEDANVSPHRLAGIAGMCGFAELSQSWSAVDRGEGNLLTAINRSREAIAQIERALLGG